MTDFRDTVVLWLIAAAAILAGTGALTVAAMVPLPLAIGLYTVGVMVLLIAALYLCTGIASAVVGFSKLRR